VLAYEPGQDGDAGGDGKGAGGVREDEARKHVRGKPKDLKIKKGPYSLNYE
jgi:hypothetical protein